MSPRIKGGGAMLSKSVATNKITTPTGQERTGRFNNDTGADSKKSLLVTTPRTNLSALSPIKLKYI